jgi:ABC-2 type transport system ATP-binding protein
MRVSDLEKFHKGFYPEWDARVFRTVVDHFDLDPASRAGKVSRGQRAGLSLALALATRPELLVMDDPAMGLDPVARRMLLEAMILLMRDSGHTILFSSHILDDVERVADHIAILDRSILRVSCPVESFRARIKRLTLTFAGQPPPAANIPGILETRQDGNDLRLTLANYAADAERAIAALEPLSIAESPLPLEDAVIAYLGNRDQRLSLLQQTSQEGVTP